MAKKDIRDDITHFHEHGIYLPTRTIYVGSEHISDADQSESGCDALMAERAAKNLHILDSMSEDPINIVMNNIGGDEYHCFAIYDAIKGCRNHVVITVLGHAMSAGSLILQAADERVMAPTSRQMMHYGTWGIHDHAKTTQKWAKEGLKIDQWMEQLYLGRIREKHPTFSLTKLKNMLDHDTFLTAAESVSLGLCDRVTTPKKVPRG